LDTNAAGAPAAESFDKILRILFTPEEAEVANHLTWRLQPVSRLAEKIGMEPEKLTAILEGMADRGVIFAKPKPGEGNRYCLLPTIPGIYEIPFMRAERIPRAKELGKLWQQYHLDGMGNSHAGSPTPQVRVIAVQEAMPMTSEILPYHIVSDMISRAGAISLTNCACRVSVGACDKPLEVCFSFDDTARFLVERDRARFVDKEEALKVLKFAEEAGLVHAINNSGDKPGIICNCCSCCCTLLRGINELHNPNAIATSAYIIEYSPDECSGCQVCVERCQVYAIQESDDLVAVDPERCIGCGLCVTSCPSGSLTLKLRATPPAVFATGQELNMTILKEKGKLEDYTRVNQE
jgi:NAD-dependent dihydropyrimidine dehydrogenase PreA subunit